MTDTTNTANNETTKPSLGPAPETKKKESFFDDSFKAGVKSSLKTGVYIAAMATPIMVVAVGLSWLEKRN